MKRFAHGPRIAADHDKVGACRCIRLLSTLLPVAKGSERNLEPTGEIFLGQAESAADDADPRCARHPLHVLRRQRLRIGISQGRLMPLRFGHRVEVAPIMLR